MSNDWYNTFLAEKYDGERGPLSNCFEFRQWFDSLDKEMRNP